ncbi:Hsp20/alpha crystallin family protein [Undibacterium sp.]|jgi:HSP20 family protein|uniref:Hsp20/alpha crystallin family protein n=1 Tax=Undibacterium sp. TaxID=1914977 RepID=UPI002C0445BC|nr:Hsp20/alpha crystallin family protein [Undibacterium sp.]HTD05257.1 Hsp20/alpha crystallin family protein [Undibacterium sp.]
MAVNTRTASTDVAVREQEREKQLHRNRNTVAPHVDIFEDAEGVTVIADLPGVPKERLDIRVEGNQLFIEGEASIQVAAGFKLHHAEVLESVYRRTFTLSREIDSTGIDANLKDGVLTLRLPKAEQAKPRRIAIRSA